MKRIITISFIALFAISFSGFAQDITVNPNTPSSEFGQIQYESPDAITIRTQQLKILLRVRFLAMQVVCILITVITELLI